MDADTLVGLLAEPERRAVVAAMILGAVDRADIVATSGLSARAAADALARLEAGGLVEAEGDQVVLLAEAFKLAARRRPRPTEGGDFDDHPDEAARVLSRAFDADGRLAHFPTKRAKRLIVLDHLAQLFEPGEHYTERQVNAALAAIDDDTAMLRRWLVDEGFLDRAGGEYWRSGGTVG